MTLSNFWLTPHLRIEALQRTIVRVLLVVECWSMLLQRSQGGRKVFFWDLSFIFANCESRLEKTP